MRHHWHCIGILKRAVMEALCDISTATPQKQIPITDREDESPGLGGVEIDEVVLDHVDRVEHDADTRPDAFAEAPVEPAAQA